MRVASISFRDPNCGVAAYTADLDAELEKITVLQRVSMQASDGSAEFRQMAEKINRSADIAHVQYHPHLCGDWSSPKKLYQFRSFLREIKIPRVVTVHDLLTHLAPRPQRGINFRRLFFNRIVVPIVNHTPFGEFLRGGFLSNADRLLVHSGQIRSFLQSLHLDPRKISVFYPGLPEPVTPAAPSVWKRQCGEKKIMTVFGFIHPGKGYETVLHAMKALPEDWILMIAGDIRTECHRSYLKKLEETIGSLNLSERVVITKFLEANEASALLSASDLILLPYKPGEVNGASYALSYALAAKRPIITSDTPYFYELQQQYGILRTFPAGNPQALAAAIRETAENKERTLSQISAAEAFRKEWGWKKVAEKLLGIYQQLLDCSKK